MFVNRLPQSYQHLDVITAARLLAIRADAQPLSAPHGDDCICRVCLPPGPERERVLLAHWHDHLDEYDAEGRS